MKKFATKMSAICIFSITAFFGSDAHADNFFHGMTADDLVFMVSVGMIDEQFLSLVNVHGQHGRSLTTYNELDRRNSKGVSGLDLGSGR